MVALSRPFVVLAALLVGGCDGYTAVKGKVVDETGRSIPGAAVQLRLRATGRARSVSTRQDGAFGVGLVHAPFRPGAIELVVEADGYARYVELVAPFGIRDRQVQLGRARP